ncbi:hypothetical protein [Geodermatophilus sp. DSM 44513]|uniref:hypothetical protein n=1 Tax=Geodermatophilus sp. DSM 44513 TaxID=1528104 RepID=UPI00126C8124|nr:hypothetical protein [Geodermatophilus sp. DSM 44513]WNV76527.1 hypothetical protein RTG05_04460 [Geodermatophilus sp. DSM 44513]
MTSADRRTVTVERLIPAAADLVFAVLVSPADHVGLDGSGMLQGSSSTSEPLRLGVRFTMAMKQGPLRYRSVNEVTAFEPNRVLAWRTTGEWRGRSVVGGQWWRFTLLPTEDGTLVRHSYEWGRAVYPRLTIQLPRYPQRMARTMPVTLERLEQTVLARQGP